MMMMKVDLSAGTHLIATKTKDRETAKAIAFYKADLKKEKPPLSSHEKNDSHLEGKESRK